MSESILSSEEKDALKEVCNIGTGQALSQVSEITEAKVKMNIPEADVVKTKNMLSYVNDISKVEKEPISVFYSIKSVSGGILVSAPQEDMKQLLNEEDSGEFRREFGREMEKVILSYLNGINDFLSLDLTLESGQISYKYPGVVIHQFAQKAVLTDEETLEDAHVMLTVSSLSIADQVKMDIVMLVGLEDLDEVLDSLEQVLGE